MMMTMRSVTASRGRGKPIGLAPRPTESRVIGAGASLTGGAGGSSTPRWR